MNDRPKKRLLRSTDERILAGVAGGLARYLDVDPTLVRVAFVAAVLFGGLGIAAYLVLAVVTPKDDGSGAPVEGDRPSPWLVILAVLVVLVLLPGPFWGPLHWGPGWWWGGSLWLLLLVGGGVWLYLVLRDRGGRGPTPAGGDSRGEEPGGTARLDPGPTDAQQGSAQGPRTDVNRLGRAFAIALLALFALTLATAVMSASVWVTATGNGAIVAGAVIALGAALVIGAFVGGARWQWLLAPALLLALPAGAVAAADVRFDGAIGDREYSPATAAAIDGDGYSLGVGHLVVDLRELPWPRGQTRSVTTDMGVGQTIVSVPSHVCVEADARARVGEVLMRGQHSAGVDPEVVEAPTRSDAPRLVLDSEVDIGQLTVTDRSPEDVDEGRENFGHEDEENERERLRAQEACEP